MRFKSCILAGAFLTLVASPLAAQTSQPAGKRALFEAPPKFVELADGKGDAYPQAGTDYLPTLFVFDGDEVEAYTGGPRPGLLRWPSKWGHEKYAAGIAAVFSEVGGYLQIHVDRGHHEDRAVTKNAHAVAVTNGFSPAHLDGVPLSASLRYYDASTAEGSVGVSMPLILTVKKADAEKPLISARSTDGPRFSGYRNYEFQLYEPGKYVFTVTNEAGKVACATFTMVESSKD